MDIDLIPRARFEYDVGYLKDLHCGDCSDIQPKDSILKPTNLVFKPPDKAVCPKCKKEIIEGGPDEVGAALKLYMVVTG